MNIQDEMQKIHHKYGVSEKANYEIEKFVEKLIEDDRAEQLILHNVSKSFYTIEESGQGSKNRGVIGTYRTRKEAEKNITDAYYQHIKEKNFS
jgi:AMMECR1 domain-containing protein